MHDKRSAQEVIRAYRRRKQMAQQLPLFYGLGLALLIAGGIYLLYRVVDALVPAPAPVVTEAPAASETLLPTEAVSPAAPRALDSSPPPAVLLATRASAGVTENRVYTVKQGDTLAGIAAQFNVNLQAIIDLNPDLDPDLISVGQEIQIPAASTQVPAGGGAVGASGGLAEYQVVEGDTLAAIAGRFNTTVAAIVAENNLESADVIQVGTVLRIPASPAPPVATGTLVATGPIATSGTEVVATQVTTPNP
jgi:LysM repeat protein